MNHLTNRHAPDVNHQPTGLPAGYDGLPDHHCGGFGNDSRLNLYDGHRARFGVGDQGVRDERIGDRCVWGGSGIGAAVQLTDQSIHDLGVDDG